MKFFRSIKKVLYPLRLWYAAIFKYPADEISYGKKIDYDAYWKDKRGADIGALSEWQRERAEIVLKNISDKENISVLDIGCGDGSVLNFINSKKKLGEMIGIDVSGFALKKAEAFGVATIQKDINALSAIDIPEVDYILLFETLEHIPNPEDFLAMVQKRARKGVFFSFPNSGFFTYRLRLLFGKFPAQWRIHPGEHVRFWTARDLKWWLRALGYRNYNIFYYRGVSILNKLFPSLFAAGFVVFVFDKDQD